MADLATVSEALAVHELGELVSVINPNARRKTYRISEKAAADFEKRCQL